MEAASSSSLVLNHMWFPYPGLCHQHVVPQDRSPATGELADIGDHHDGKRGGLKVNKDLEIT